MKKVIYGIVIGIVMLLVAGVIANESFFMQCFQKNISCKQAKEDILSKRNNDIEKFNEFSIGAKESNEALLNLVDLYEKNGYDVTVLRQKLIIFNNKFEKLTNDYKIYLTIMEKLGDSTCDKTSLEKVSYEINNQKQILKDDTLDLQSYQPEVEFEIGKLK